MVDGAGRGAGERFALRTLSGLVVYFAVVQALCLGASVAGLTIVRGVAAFMIALAAAAGMLVGRGLDLEDGRPGSAGGGNATPSPLSWVLGLTAIGWMVSLWLRLWVLVFRRPPYDWDGLYYHLPALHEWVRAGRVGWLDHYPDVPFVNFPMAVEAHAFVVHQLTGAPALVDGWNLWYWPLALFSVVVVAQRLGATGGWSWLAGGLLTGAPVLVSQSATCYVDPGFAAAVMAAVACGLLVVSRRDGMGWRWVVLWGASLGLMLGAKITGAPFVVLLLSLALVFGARRDGAGPMARRVALAASVALLVGGYWYVRAVAHTGNPIHPHELKIGHNVLIAGYDLGSLSLNAPEFLRGFPRWSWPAVSWLQLDAPISGYAPAGGLGYIWPLAGLPAAAILVAGACRRLWRHSGRRADLWVVYLGLSVLLLFAVQPEAWWSRLTLWLHVLGLPALAMVWSRRSEPRSSSRRLAVAGAVALLALAVLESERTFALERKTGRDTTRRMAAAIYQPSASFLFPGLPTREGFDRLLQSEVLARSRWSRAGTLLGGILAMPPGEREIRVLAVSPSSADVERLRREGVRWILWDVVAAGEFPPALRPAVAEEHEYDSGQGAHFLALLLKRPDADGEG